MSSSGSPPGALRVAAAILPLPFTVTVVLPAIILALAPGQRWPLEGSGLAAAIAAGGFLLALGIGIFVATVRLFASVGRGTLAPWDPPRRLVVRGPYRHLRHPMISAVALVLAGEALLFGSGGIAILLAAFVLVNAVYLPLVEEPSLRRRFGAEYERYMANVPRWLPRRRPWDG